ncbi:PID-CTERM protein-sorting domain-containing protein [Gelidibacter japonicus]|uniref:PID-CTERM protein-sorting domain-containing protein n=1 Tax=Gelidibacter japonicus TaxID=1962232 RepID=UPI003A923AFD
MIKLYKKITASILLMLISITGIAQDSVGGGSGPPPPQGSPPPGLPIDDGLVVLLVAALIYGVYIILRHSKKHSQV